MYIFVYFEVRTNLFAILFSFMLSTVPGQVGKLFSSFTYVNDLMPLMVFTNTVITDQPVHTILLETQ